MPPRPELVDAAYRLLQDQADMVRASGMFGEDILVPAGVGPRMQLLAFHRSQRLEHRGRLRSIGSGGS